MATTSPAWRTTQFIIVAGCTIALLSFGVRSAFGLFLAPMSADLGWAREVFALAIAIQNLLWGLGQPFAGALADRWGCGRVLALGGILYAAGLLTMAHADTPLALHLSAGVMIGLGLAGASFSIVLAAFGRMVDESRRSWALGLGTAAGSLGQFLMAPLGQAFLSAYGWQVALMLLAACAFMVVPLSGVLAGQPEPRSGGQTFGQALREAGSHSGFLLLTAGFFVCGFHVAFIQVHLPSYLLDVGLAPSLGAWAIATVGLFNVAGAYGSGVLGGRLRKKYLLSSIYLARAVVIAVFISVPMSAASVLVFAAVMGLLWLSTVPLTSGLVAQIFGTRYMATLFGIVFLSHQVGAFFGVWLGGRLYDSTGSYQVVWWLSIALGVIAAIVHFPIDDRRVERAAAASA